MWLHHHNLKSLFFVTLVCAGFKMQTFLLSTQHVTSTQKMDVCFVLFSRVFKKALGGINKSLFTQLEKVTLM